MHSIDCAALDDVQGRPLTGTIGPTRCKDLIGESVPPGHRAGCTDGVAMIAANEAIAAHRHAAEGLRKEAMEGASGAAKLRGIVATHRMLQAGGLRHAGPNQRCARTNAPDASVKGNVATRAAADTFATNVLPIVLQIQVAGTTTHRAIAEIPSARGIRVARGGCPAGVGQASCQSRILYMQSATWLGQGQGSPFGADAQSSRARSVG